ncbi:MAG: HAD-IA family hydrolase [Acidobacteria bacterium]|nr:HAD-IA family hydrolase [Acidobacteriota bacterium]
MAVIIEAVTFDWYGTLANHRNAGRRILFSEYLVSHGLQSAPWDRGVLYEVFDFYGSVYDPASSEGDKRIFWIEFTKRLFERSAVSGVTAAQCEFHAPAIRAIFGSDSFQLYPDVQPVLHALKRNKLKLGVISNWHSGLDSFCHEMNLAGLFDTVIASSDLGIEKPDSRVFHEAARRLTVNPDRIVHIGDLPNDDFDGAVAAGLRAVLIDRLNNHPTHRNRIGNLYELQEQLKLLEFYGP